MTTTRKARVPMAEQIRPINECRQSGMTDADWCRENAIAVSTFYNWVSRCRKAAADQIPAPNYGHCQIPRSKQDVVPVDIVSDPLPEQHTTSQIYQMNLDIVPSRTTLANWIIYCSRNYFQPMYDYFHRELLKRSFAMADETRIQVLKEEERRAQTQSFMWLFRSGEDGLPAIILYGYSPTRSGSHAKEFLEGYQGYLETDGYQGYNSLPDIKRCSCWAHIRRYFIDAVPKGKQYDYSQPAVQGVQYCNRLFAIEDSITKKYPGDYEKRKQLRLEKEKPVLEAFWSWLEQQKPVRNTRMDKAVNYVRNRRETAETYLEDGRCSFTNNLSENAIRPFAVGRKNWLFSDSVEGANASAVVYTMVEMAKAHDLNVYGYLKFLLDHRPTKEMTDDQLAELAPWSEKLQSIKNRM